MESLENEQSKWPSEYKEMRYTALLLKSSDITTAAVSVQKVKPCKTTHQPCVSNYMSFVRWVHYEVSARSGLNCTRWWHGKKIKINTVVASHGNKSGIRKVSVLTYYWLDACSLLYCTCYMDNKNLLRKLEKAPNYSSPNRLGTAIEHWCQEGRRAVTDSLVTRLLELEFY